MVLRFYDKLSRETDELEAFKTIIIYKNIYNNYIYNCIYIDMRI